MDTTVVREQLCEDMQDAIMRIRVFQACEASLHQVPTVGLLPPEERPGHWIGPSHPSVVHENRARYQQLILLSPENQFERPHYDTFVPNFSSENSVPIFHKFFLEIYISTYFCMVMIYGSDGNNILLHLVMLVEISFI